MKAQIACGKTNNKQSSYLLTGLLALGAVDMKTSSLFDDDDEEAAAPPPPTSTSTTETFEAQWLRERERRLDLEVEVFELKELVKQLRQQLEQYEGPLPVAAQKTTTTTATMGLFDESDSDDEDPADFGVASSSVQGIGKQDMRTEPLSEWEKLALEEKERRKLKARQRQQRTPVGRKNLSRRQAAASAQAPLGGATVQQLASKVSAEDLLGVHLPSPASAAAPAVSAATTPAARTAHGHRSSFSSSSASSASSASVSSSSAFSDDEEDESVGWDDDPAAPASSPSPTRVSLSLSSAAAHNAHATSASLERDLTLSSEQLEAEVEAAVIAWARGKDIVSMLLSVSTVFYGPMPELSADKLRGASTPRPEDVRKAYLRVVRCCHPDKQPADVAPRVRAQASKVFSALTDAFSAFKAANGLQ